MRAAQDIILAPVISEKSMDGTEVKKYTFKVAKNATKPEIAAAVATIFGVKALSVHTVIVPGKPKRRGVTEGYTSEWKKAVVTTDGTIEFFDGMR